MSTRRLSPLPVVTAALLGALAAGLVLSGGACAPAAPPPVVLAPEPPPPPRPPALPAAWTYWEPVDATVRVGGSAPALPLTEAQLGLDGGAAARWERLSPAAQNALLSDGVVVTPAVPGTRFGEAYAALAAARVPYVVTMDALFWVAHVARDRALAAAEDAVLAPALDRLLERLEVRLAEGVRGAPGDLLAGYGIARGVVAVARALLSPGYRAAPDLARVVAEETKRVAEHAGPRVSALLGVTVDYSQIVPRGAADLSAARAGYALATEWLGTAPLALVARGEMPGAQSAFGAARAHARAALLLARLVDFDVDAEAAYAMRRWMTVAEFVGGPSDDVSPQALLEVARSLGIDAREPRAIVDVVKIDRLRHALAGGHGARLDDGSGIAGVPTRAGKAIGADYARAATSVRLLPARDTADAELLEALVAPNTARAMPQAADVMAWLAEPRKDARAARHDSVYASSLEAIAAYLAPSAADAAQPGASSAAWRDRKVEAALAAWTTLRHDALPFARFPIATPSGAGARAASAPAPSPASAGDVPAFVEPHVEAIAELLAMVRQSTRGLRAFGEVPEGSPAIPILDASERLLADALAIAIHEAEDEPLTPALREAMGSFASRLAELEARLAPSRAADAAIAVDVHTDLKARLARVEACGDLDDVTLVMREPGTGRLVLAAGIAASHYELDFPASARPTDATWRARLHAEPAPDRDAFMRILPLAPPAGDAGADAAEDPDAMASPY